LKHPARGARRICGATPEKRHRRDQPGRPCDIGRSAHLLPRRRRNNRVPSSESRTRPWSAGRINRGFAYDDLPTFDPGLLSQKDALKRFGARMQSTLIT
jgi:hypothetical protein